MQTRCLRISACTACTLRPRRRPAAPCRRAGVLTKLDIMDRGTDALPMLRNDVLPLRLGYIAVINRSQADIQQATPVAVARRAEAQFFRSHPQYSDVEKQCGVPALSRRCG
jgi:replication fork clamp-binding protein CrfC